MRTSKSAQARRDAILEAAGLLFTARGYEETTISDILRAVGIARGTLYHYFDSKESIMDGMIEKHTARILDATRQAAVDRSKTIQARFEGAMGALMLWAENAPASRLLLDHLHQQRNLLMHHKINSVMLAQLPPILAEVIKDGIKEGLFNTPYPLECAEMAVTYVQMVFNDDMLRLSPEARKQRIRAYVYQLERMLGSKEGALHYFVPLFEAFQA